MPNLFLDAIILAVLRRMEQGRTDLEIEQEFKEFLEQANADKFNPIAGQRTSTLIDIVRKN
jgi:hypothetical protein